MPINLQPGKILSFLFCLLFLSGKAQQNPTDSIPVHSPRKAAMLSAVLPGAGQYYNKKYWKIGVIAAGAGALVYGYQFNTRYYHQYKNELITREQHTGIPDPGLERYTNSNLNELQSFYRRNRDLTVIGFALLYALNVLDATVDAHLFDFDLDQSLSMRVRPSMQPIPGNFAIAKGLSFQFSF